MSNFFRKYGIFLFVPGIVLACSVLLRLAAGPYWLASNYDPSYVYLCNGLHILKGAPVNEALHPGTPLQILCGVVCWLCNMGKPLEGVATHVFLDPEFYLHVVFAILSLFTFFTSLALAVYVYRKTGDTLAAILTQLPALCFLVMKSRDTLDPVLTIVTNVSPEPMLIGMVNLFNICLLMCFFAETTKDKYVLSLWWGFVCGMAVAVKLTFLPLLLVPFIVLSWKNRIMFICLFIVTFFVWTLPAFSKYSQQWGCLTGFFLHKGSYGVEGQARGIDLYNYYQGWQNIITSYWIFAGIVLAALLLVFWKFVSKQWEKTSFFLLVTILGVLFQFAAVAKNPGAHYLLPGIGLFSALLVFFYWLWPHGHLIGRRIVLVLVSASILGGSWQALAYRSDMASFTKGILIFYDRINAKYKGYVFVKYYRSSGQDAALLFGDAWNGEFQFRDLLYRLYPQSYFLNFGWNNYIMSFKDRVFSNDLLDRSAGVLFQGDDTNDIQRNLIGSPFSLQLLEKGRFENIFLLTKTTEKQAFVYYAGAAHYLQVRDINNAWACALRAKALHFQPAGDVDKFIQLLAPYVQH